MYPTFWREKEKDIKDQLGPRENKRERGKGTLIPNKAEPGCNRSPAGCNRSPANISLFSGINFLGRFWSIFYCRKEPFRPKRNKVNQALIC